jgi:hypothetical protein
MTDPILCAHCASDVPATHWLGERDAYDPCCASHFAALFDTCQACQRTVLKDELGSYESAPQTWWTPAEHEPCCVYCAPDPEPDEDRRDWDDVRAELEGWG